MMKTELKFRAAGVGAFVFALIILLGSAARAQVEIRNWHDLNNMRNNLSGSYVLMNDLDETIEGYVGYNSGLGWEPIGGELYDDYFAGKFDGRGNTVPDLVINRPDTDGVGLFKHLHEEAEISTALNREKRLFSGGGRGMNEMIVLDPGI